MINNNQFIVEYYDISCEIQKATNSKIFKFSKTVYVRDQLTMNILNILIKTWDVDPQIKRIESNVNKMIYDFIKDFDFIDSTYDQFCSGLLEVQNKVIEDELKRLGKAVGSDTTGT